VTLQTTERSLRVAPLSAGATPRSSDGGSATGSVIAPSKCRCRFFPDQDRIPSPKLRLGLRRRMSAMSCACLSRLRIGYSFGATRGCDSGCGGACAMPDLPFLPPPDQMRRLSPYVPRSRGIPRVDDRRVPSRITLVIKRGLNRRDAPPGYGPTRTLSRGVVRSSRMDVVDRSFAALAAAAPRHWSARDWRDAAAPRLPGRSMAQHRRTSHTRDTASAQGQSPVLTGVRACRRRCRCVARLR